MNDGTAKVKPRRGGGGGREERSRRLECLIVCCCRRRRRRCRRLGASLVDLVETPLHLVGSEEEQKHTR